MVGMRGLARKELKSNEASGSKRRKIRESAGCCNEVSLKKPARQHFDPCVTGHVTAVKSALHLATVPDVMLCRDGEQSKIFEFCKDHLLQQEPGSLYICGCPGTGKSLLMERVKAMSGKWAKEGGLPAPEIFSFNCTTLTSPSDIFERIFTQVSTLSMNTNINGKLDGLKMLKQAARMPTNKSSCRMLMLIIDEMDYLLGKDRSVLHELFELSAQVDSRCILIGISNAINLADRFLPKLACLSRLPVVIPFSPYTKDQVLAVLGQRLKTLPFDVFDQAALELCARRVSAASGDMRKALHVCRIAVELLESEARQGKEADSANSGSKEGAPIPLLLSSNKMADARGGSSVCMVLIHHMAQALAKTFRSAVVDTVKSLPKHQQMVLCSAVRLFRQKKKDATLGQLNGGYVEFCKSTDIPALSVPEFSSVCRVLADQGLLKLGSSKEDRLRRVTLHVDQEDIIFALQSVRFFGINLS